jgi:hypothetical protein
MKRFISILLCALMLSTTAVYAIPSGVVTTTAKIGNSTANLVYIDMSSPNRTGEAVVAGKLTTAAASDLIGRVDDGQVVAAMNGGFFNAYYDPSKVSYPDNYPRIYGTVVSEGAVLNSGASGPGLVFEPNGTPHIGYVTAYSSVTVNGSASSDLSACYTDAHKESVYVEQGKMVAYIKNNVVTGVVESKGVNITVPSGSMVAIGDMDALKVGDKVQYKTEIELDGKAVDGYTAITCGPRLLENGVNTAASGNSGNYDSKQNANAVAQRSFAAIAPDGRLILGTAVTSPNSIATYLQSIGVKDALLYDGGASSMLYVKDKGFTTRAGRNLASIFTIVDRYTPAVGHNAMPSEANVMVNSVPVDIEAYTINNNNYFRIRDIAYIMRNTSAAFDVGWDSTTGTVTITSGTYSGQRDYSGDNSPADAVRSEATIVVNGQTVAPEVYNIDGSNYFKLRDIADYVGAEVTWDAENSVINITVK